MRSPHISTHLHTSQHRGANAGIFQLHPTSRLRWLPNYFHKNPLFGTGRSGSLWDWGCPRVPDRTYPTIDAIASAGRAGTSTSPRHIESQLERVNTSVSCGWEPRGCQVSSSKQFKHGHLGNHGTLMNFMNFKKFGFIMGKQRV